MHHFDFVLNAEQTACTHTRESENALGNIPNIPSPWAYKKIVFRIPYLPRPGRRWPYVGTSNRSKGSLKKRLKERHFASSNSHFLSSAYLPDGNLGFVDQSVFKSIASYATSVQFPGKSHLPIAMDGTLDKCKLDPNLPPCIASRLF